mgnify:CR=1 FL=1
MRWSAVAAPLQRFWPAAAVVGGAVVLLESSHGALSSLFNLGAAAAGLWWFSNLARPDRRLLPTTSRGWFERCEAVLCSFERLEQADTLNAAAEAAAGRVALAGRQEQRRQQLADLRSRQDQPHLHLALVGSLGWSDALQNALLQHCPSPSPLQVHRSHPLPASGGTWQWPELFRQSDLLIYRLDLPLKAADLRWLEALPAAQPVVLLVDQPAQGDWMSWQQQLEGQLPQRLRERCWCWSPEPANADQLRVDLAPLAQLMAGLGVAQRQATQLRCLEELHGAWQLELESLRRARWQQLLQRTQWTVAAGVVMAPLPSLDLLVLAAANGLMLQEMARLWECPWSGDQLKAAAVQLAQAALSLGVVEWSSQALASIVKLHGATWLVGSALQAMSAAYLTRVVGRAMADYMALAVGVPEAELEALLARQAPLLVARAAEQEKVNWNAFLQQGLEWWQAQRLQSRPV